MSLSEFNIQILVMHETRKAIFGAQYETLRNYLLQRKPLDIVIQNINIGLSSQCASDKLDWQRQLTMEACQSQKQQDVEAAIQDEAERVQDQLLSEKYSKELPVLQNLAMHLDSKQFFQQSVINHVQGEIDEFTVNLHQLDHQISQVRQELFALENPTHHSHPSQEEGHPDHTHGHPNTDYKGLRQKEKYLVEEHVRLQSLIALKEVALGKDKHTLRVLQNEHQDTNNRCAELVHHFEVVFPEKAKQRSVRQAERNLREQARSMYDEELHQLSAENLASLHQKIHKKNMDLDAEKQQLLQQAMQQSFPIYLSLLEGALLTPNTLNVTYFQNEALKSIHSLMKSYLKMVEREKHIHQALEDATHKLKLVQSRLKENNTLYLENIQLAINSNSAAQVRKSALYIALFGGGGALLSLGMLKAYAVSPLVFVIPEALAAIALFALVVALIYHFQKSSAEQHIIANDKRIL